jgi:hypothetical protein
VIWHPVTLPGSKSMLCVTSLRICGAVVAALLFFGLGACPVTAQPPQTFRGRPYDVDFIENADWVQVIIKGPGSSTLVAYTKNVRVETIVLSSVALREEIEVKYVEGNVRKLVDAKLADGPPLPAPQPGTGDRVVWIEFDETQPECRTRIYKASGQNVDLTVPDQRAQAILESAMQMKIPVQELSYDPNTKRLTRVKVNQPVP